MDGRIAVLSIAAFAGVLLAGAVVQAGGLPSFGGGEHEEEEHARPVATAVPAVPQAGAALVTVAQDAAPQGSQPAASAPVAQAVPAAVAQAPAARRQSDDPRRTTTRNERERREHHGEHEHDDEDDD